jgi:B12-binding domain/radical SAM domain protein
VAAEEKDRPYLALRKTKGNRYSLPVVLGSLETEGLTREFEVVIAESSLEIAESLGRRKGIVGFSFMTPHLAQVRKELDLLRKTLRGETLLIAGGAHAAGDPAGTVSLGFDFVFCGAAEQTFPAFLRGYLNGKMPDTAILYGEKDSPFFASCPPHSLEHNFFSPIEITRGCYYQCAFCQAPRIFGRKIHHRSPGNVASHLARTAALGYRETAFVSSNAFSYGSCAPRKINHGAIEELLTAVLGAGLEGIRFGCYPSEVRPDWVTPGILEIVKKYCRNKTIVLGAQSGSDSLLASVRRGHTAQEAWQAVRWIAEAGFTPHVDFVFGFPGESLEDRRLSLEMMGAMIRDCEARIHAHTYMPLPGTPLFPLDPAPLDDATKNALRGWERRQKLDGWWQEQEGVAREIVRWRDEGTIRIAPDTESILQRPSITRSPEANP